MALALAASLARLHAWLSGRDTRLEGDRDPLGHKGEKAAARHLKTHGYTVLGRNLITPIGEADMLALAPDRQTIVFVEVKTRRTKPGDAALPPEASITAHKRDKLLAVSRHLIQANAWTNRPVRIDVIAVEWPDAGKPVIRHHESAVKPRP